MSFRLLRARLKGTVTIHASKSQSHRSIIAASLSKGCSKIYNFQLSNDTAATLSAVEQLGWATYHYSNNLLTMEGGLSQKPQDPIFCAESATTLRLLMPLAIVKNGGGCFTGDGLLLNRPMLPYINLFKEHDISYTATKKYIEVRGLFKSSSLVIDGSVSSQFISGLLFTLPLFAQGASLSYSGPLVSRSYISLTEEMIAACGVVITSQSHQWCYHRGDYKAFTLTLEGDYSNGAWFLAANSLGHQIDIKGLNPLTVQGDHIIHHIIASLSANKASLTLECDSFIDLVPLIAVLCALGTGSTTLTHLSRLRDKECNRLEAITATLERCGAKMTTNRIDQITIIGQPSLKGGVLLSSYGDHRIAMAIALMALHCEEPISIDEPDVVAKSYPNFWHDYQQLGGVVDEL